jgi:hypothetical protein
MTWWWTGDETRKCECDATRTGPTREVRVLVRICIASLITLCRGGDNTISIASLITLYITLYRGGDNTMIGLDCYCDSEHVTRYSVMRLDTVRVDRVLCCDV